MLRRITRYTLGMLIACLLSIAPSYSQNDIDPEAEYLRIRELAFQGNYTTAAAEARRLVNNFPAYGDARILLGRIMAWQKDYINAAAVIDTLLMSEPNNEDALSARRDISLWSKDNSPVVTDIRAGYFFDTYSVPYSRFWQVFKAGMGHNFSWGPASANINVGNIILDEPSSTQATELQFEVDAYPKLTDKNYAYLDYAYSPGKYFPTHRAALEVWQILPARFAVSAGVNYYYFDRNIFIGLASVEKYLGKYWFSFKTYVYFKDNGPTTSFYLNARRYLKGQNYLQLTLGTGTAPDEPFDLQTSIMRLRAHSIRLAYNVSVSSKLMVRLNAGYSREKYEDALWRNRFEGGINLTYAIKMK